MSIEQNKALVRRYFEEAPHNAEVYDEILASEFRVQSIHHATITPAAQERGPKPFKALAAWLNSVWSNPSLTVDEMRARAIG